MSDRVLKFRAWDTTKKDMILLELQHVSSFSHYDYYKIMQWTRLTDRSGQEIYEGDIVQVDSGLEDFKPGSIVWHNGGFVVKSLKSKRSAPLHTWVGWEEKSDYVEVIGNIYDHPELLKEGNQ